MPLRKRATQGQASERGVLKGTWRRDPNYSDAKPECCAPVARGWASEANRPGAAMLVGCPPDVTAKAWRCRVQTAPVTARFLLGSDGLFLLWAH